MEPVVQPRQLDRRDAMIAAALFAVTAVAGAFRIAPGVCGAYHDDAVYVASAEALATGAGYRLTRVPGAPHQTKYPILYPAALAVIWRIWPQFPDNLAAMHGLSLLCGCGVIGLSYLYLVRRKVCARGIALTAALITATSSSFLYYCTTTMAEMPFALAVLLALWILDSRLDKQPPENGRAADDPAESPATWLLDLAVGAMLTLPFLCRTVGAAFIPAALLLLWRRGHTVRWVAAGAAATGAPWLAWSLLGHGQFHNSAVTGYYTDYVGSWVSNGLTMFGRIVSVNAFSAAHGIGELAAEGLLSLAGARIYGGYTAVIIAAAGGMACLSILRDALRGRALATFLIAYLGLIVVWPWPPHRFLIPLQVFLVSYLLRCLLAIATSFGDFLSAAAMRWAPAAAATILVGNGCLLAHHAQVVRQHGYPQCRRGDDQANWSSYKEVFDWLRRHAHRDDLIASGLDSMASLYTGLTSVRPYAYRPTSLFYGDNSGSWLTARELAMYVESLQARYVVDTPMPGFAEYQPLRAALKAAAAAHPRWLKTVYIGADERFVIYRVDSDFAPSDWLTAQR